MLLKNARIVIRQNETIIQDVLIEQGVFTRIAPNIDADVETIDLEGKLLLPGGVDVHVHLREPGYTHKETIVSASHAALAGGYTTLCAMANVLPAPDNPETVAEYLKLIEDKRKVNIYPYACITKKSHKKELVDFKALSKLGIKWVSDDGIGVQSEAIMEQAMLLAKQNDIMIVAHAEDLSLVNKGGSVHLGEYTDKLGLIGISSESEYKQIERDLKLAQKTKAKYHVCHVSCKESVDLIRQYKALGVDVSAEVTTHHLLLCDHDVSGTQHKMNPPLRASADRLALIEGLLDGTLDMIANDHAPHTDEEKNVAFQRAPFGVVGLETSIVLIYTHFVKTGIISLEQFINLTSLNAAKRFGMKQIGKIEAGYKADCYVLNEGKYIINKDSFLSKSNNTPFNGYEINATIDTCIVGGKVAYFMGGITE